MPSKPIPQRTAKDELARIDEALPSPHLLIGGLAVQQYYRPRKSADIDLICDFDTARDLLERLYPNNEWEMHDENDDEYRPSFRIVNKFRPTDIGDIVFGPKIGERGAYDYIDWDSLRDNARPFVHLKRTLPNVLVPPPHALAYTKFISFLSRVEKSPQKGLQDPKDFVNLTNVREFSCERFHALIEQSGKRAEIVDKFRLRSALYRDTLTGSHLQDLATLFPDPVWAVSAAKREVARANSAAHHFVGYWTSKWRYGDEDCVDLLHIDQIQDHNVLGRRAAITGKYQYSYILTGICRGDLLHLIARPGDMTKPFAVSIVLEMSDKFGDRLEGIAIRPAGNAVPDDLSEEAFMNPAQTFWASKARYDRVKKPAEESPQLWKLLR